MAQYLVVLITVPSQEVAQQISETLLEQKLAASVNIIPAINSWYIWQNEVRHAPELLLVVKTKASIFEEKFIAAVQAIHPYDVPGIIALPIVMGSKSYLDWIEAEVTG